MYDKVEQYVNEKLLMEQEMFNSDEYIKWLINYLEIHKNICTLDDYESYNELDRININKLFIFYQHVKKYADENYIIFDDGNNSNYIYIRFDSKLIKLEYFRGLNGQIICGLQNVESVKCIDFNNILCNIPVSNKKHIVDYQVYKYQMTDDPQIKKALYSDIIHNIREIENEQVYEFGNCRSKKGNN